MSKVVDYYEVYTGETRTLALRVVTGNGAPFSLENVIEMEARFKKANGGVLSKTLSPIKQSAKVAFSQLGSFYDVVGDARSIQLYNAPAVGHYFWFKVIDGVNIQNDPVDIGLGHQVDILLADSASTIATKFYNAVNLVIAAFTATNIVLNEVTVTNVTGGVATTPAVNNNAAIIVIEVAGKAPGITITNDKLGKYVVILAPEDTSALLVGDRQAFSIIITFTTGIRKVTYRSSLTVSRQVV